MNAAPAPLAPPANTAQTLREVRRGVAQAADAQVLKVLRMVDALEERGATDAVLDPVRPRLRAIQPARPLRFARLLFMPLDPLIVAPKLWRPGTPFLPRTALMVLARAVREVMQARQADRLADRLADIDALIAQATTAQTCIVRRAGALLWPHAAVALRVLGQAPPDSATVASWAASWAAEGLPPADLQPTALALAPILARAVALHDHDHAGMALSEAPLLDMLASAEPAGPRACGMMLSLLVVRVPHAAPALLAAAQKLAALRPLTEAAAETALAWVEAETADQLGGIGDAAASELVRQITLLDALAEQPGNALRRKRVAETRLHLLSGCLQRFEASLHEQVIGPLDALPDDPAGRDAALDAMEAAARTLRRFEVEGRRLGAAARFDALAQQVGRTVANTPGLSIMDRARLLEIVAGPEAALRVLAGP